MSESVRMDPAALAAITEPGQEPRSILVVGDSITKGVVFDEQRGRHTLLGKQSFCSLVGSHIKAGIENLSKFGCVSAAALDILTKRLSGGDAPAIVAIELGGNDCDFDWEAIAQSPSAEHLPKTSLADYEANLTAMIHKAKQSGAQPLLFNLPPIDADRYFRFFTGGDEAKAKRILEWLGSVGRIYWWHERYNAASERVAQLTGTPLLMIRAALLDAFDYRAYVSGDGLHPNAAGHQRIAGQVLEYIRTYQPALLA